jgi:hypothetical protein
VDDDLDDAGQRRERLAEALARALEQLENARDVLVVDELVARGEVRRRGLDPRHAGDLRSSPAPLDQLAAATSRS